MTQHKKTTANKDINMVKHTLTPSTVVFLILVCWQPCIVWTVKHFFNISLTVLPTVINDQNVHQANKLEELNCSSKGQIFLLGNLLGNYM